MVLGFRLDFVVSGLGFVFVDLAFGKLYDFSNRLQGLVWCSQFTVLGSGFRVQGLRSRVYISRSRFRTWGEGSGAKGFEYNV